MVTSISFRGYEEEIYCCACRSIGVDIIYVDVCFVQQAEANKQRQVAEEQQRIALELMKKLGKLQGE